MLILFFAPLAIMLTGLISNPWIIFLLYLTMGFGMAGIGMGVMHDAIHGSYSKNRKLNKFMGYTMNLIGANASIWRIQHNVLHHTYTNIEEADDDINAPFFLRFSPHKKRYWLHRFQHVYIWFFYGLSTISWITTKDFIRASRYKKMGLVPGGKKAFRKELRQIIGWKLLYFTYILILPILLVPVAPWLIVISFLAMHFLTGLMISIVFQTAHIMPTSDFPLPDKEGVVDNDWVIHQLATTSNFSPRSRIFSWFIGGLNYQVEHHLFSNICHIHYRKISQIVSETAREYGVPYYTKKTFVGAIWDHVKMLRKLGTMELAPIPQKSK